MVVKSLAGACYSLSDLIITVMTFGLGILLSIPLGIIGFVLFCVGAVVLPATRAGAATAAAAAGSRYSTTRLPTCISPRASGYNPNFGTSSANPIRSPATGRGRDEILQQLWGARPAWENVLRELRGKARVIWAKEQALRPSRLYRNPPKLGENQLKHFLRPIEEHTYRSIN